jgi:hypothetical protein
MSVSAIALTHRVSLWMQLWSGADMVAGAIAMRSDY